MEIEMQTVTVRELTADYRDDEEAGVFGYGGLLDIRPAYQREFIYKDKQREAVIDTVTKKFPLNVMYWAKRSDGTFEVVDGQQRTISICQYVNADFSVLSASGEPRYIHNLRDGERDAILDYELTVYVCSGTERDKLEWFKTINIAGERLTDQELRNAVYSGSWVSAAKRYFSKTNCLAYKIGANYMTGTPIRQDYLETVLGWISTADGSRPNVERYMAAMQHHNDASELWDYYEKVIEWVKRTFPKWRPPMKGVEWGDLYNRFGNAALDSETLEGQVATLMADEDVTAKKGIYHYVLSGQEKYLSIRAFSPNQRLEAYERQAGNCAACGVHFEFDEMEADHITPWHAGGKTHPDNCQMLCRDDNRRKSGK